MRALVMAQRMWGVPMGRIVFEDYKGIPFGKTGSVQDILDATSGVDKLIKNRNQTIEDGKTAFLRKPTPIPSTPDPRLWWGNRPGQRDVQPPAVRTL